MDGLGDTRSEMTIMKTLTIWRWFIIFWVLGATKTAWAHDPFLSYTDVLLHSNEMEVKCSLACRAALLLLNPNPTNPLPDLDEDNFDFFVPDLKQQGEKLFEIRAGGTVLAEHAVDVRLNSAADGVDFTIIFPRPPAGPLRISPTYVKRLPDEGYGTALSVFDEAGRQLAFDANLNLKNMNLNLRIPPPSKLAANDAPQTAVPSW